MEDQPTFTSESVTRAWNTVTLAVHELLQGKYPLGLDGADRTYMLKRGMEHLAGLLAPQLAALKAAEEQAPAKAEPCADCGKPAAETGA